MSTDLISLDASEVDTLPAGNWNRLTALLADKNLTPERAVEVLSDAMDAVKDNGSPDHHVRLRAIRILAKWSGFNPDAIVAPGQDFTRVKLKFEIQTTKTN